MSFKVPEQYRIKNHPIERMNSDESYGNNGCFNIPLKPSYETNAFIIASDGADWEHVSVHVIEKNKSRIPTWDEMCYIKDIFWSKEDTVIQFHPAQKNYVNNHKYVLHLWRNAQVELNLPHPELIGIIVKS